MEKKRETKSSAKRSAGLTCWTLFLPIFEFEVFNPYKFVCIIGYKNEITRNRLSCDEHIVRADKISFFFELCSNNSKLFRVDTLKIYNFKWSQEFGQ
jgi:hypothetical protein